MSAISTLESTGGLPATTTAKEPSLLDFGATIVNDVRRWQAAMALIDADGKKVIKTLVEKHAGDEGWSQGNIYKKYDAWVAAGRDWKVLLNKKPYHDLWTKSESAAQLPAEFIRFVASQMLGNQRQSGSTAAHRGIIRQWRQWLRGNPSAKIPGYETCPPVGPNGEHPVGWSYNNLMEKAQPPKVERKMAREGTVAAKLYLPCVYNTRVGARWLEYVFFDDVQLDREVVVQGYLTPVRILQLGGLDYSTGIYFPVFGQRPELPDDEGKKENLKRRDFLSLVAALIDAIGYPTDYVMHLVCERGTATMSVEEARVLYDISDGHIVVCYTGMNGQLVQAWDVKKSGNSDGKACIESTHGLIKNEMGGLIGQLGKDPDHAPAALLGMRREAIALGKASVMLSPEERARLLMPYATPDECYFDTMEIIHRINNRQDHRLEGFDFVQQWRLRGTREWHQEYELVNLDPAVRPHLEWKPRLETPMERRARLCAGVNITHLPSNIWPRFFEDSHALKKVQDRGHIETKVNNAVVMFAPPTPEEALPVGTEVLAYFAPNNPQKAYLTVKNRFIGEWPRVNRSRRDDTKARSETIRRKQIFLNKHKGNIRTTQAEEILRQDARVQHNLDLLASAGLIDKVDAETGIAAPTPGAAALQDIGRRIAAVKKEAEQNSPTDVVKTILARPIKQENPAIDENSWV